MKNNHGDTENTELHEEETGGEYKIYFFSVFSLRSLRLCGENLAVPPGLGEVF